MSFYEQPAYDDYSTDLTGVDLSNVGDWNGDYADGPLPAGKYPVVIERAEIKVSKNSGDKYISVMFRITDGDYRKRCLFDSFSIWTVNVARQRYRALRIALGLNPSNAGTLEEILNGELLVDVKLKNSTRKGHEGEQENSISSFFPLNRGKQAAAPRASARPQAHAPAGAPAQAPAAAPQAAAPQAPQAAPAAAPAAAPTAAPAAASAAHVGPSEKPW